MKYGLLKRRREQRARHNACYQRDLVLDCESLYKGGEEFEARIERYLPKSDLMAQRTYETTLSIGRVKYVNLFATVVNYYTAFLFGFPLVFTCPSDPFYARFKEDCDGNGTDLQDHFEKALTELLVGGKVATVASRREVPYAPRNAAEARQLRAQDAKLRLFGANEIHDWELDADGQLLWIILSAIEHPRALPSDEGDVRIEKYWLYTRDRVEVYAVEVKPMEGIAEDREFAPNQVIPHTYGRVPVELWELPPGKWLGSHLRNPCVDNLRARTALGYHNNKTAFPLIIQKSEATDTDPKLGEHGIKIGVNDEISLLVPQAESRVTLQDDVKDTEAKVFRTANLDFLIDSERNKPWRSASAKQQDTNTGHISLKDYGSLIREQAQRVMHLVAAVRGETDAVFDVAGFEKLDDWDLEALSKIVEILAGIDWSRLDAFGETTRRELMKRLIAQALPEADEALKQKIQADIEKSVIKPLDPPQPQNGENPNARTNQPQRPAGQENRAG